MTFVNIQGMRAVAALMVIFVHVLWPVVPLRSSWVVPYLDGVGPAGVDIFFVISGFIIYHVTDRAGTQSQGKDRLATVYEFVAKRVLRIYPIYWIVFALGTLIGGYVELSPSFLEHKPWLALSFLLTEPNYVVMAAWTLTFEIYFYAAAAVCLLLFPTRMLLGLMLWFGCIAAAHLTGSSFAQSGFANPMLFEFLLGVIVAWVIQQGVSAYGARSALVGVVLFLAGAACFRYQGGWNAVGSWGRLTCFGVPASLMVYGVVALERSGTWQFPKLLQKIGDLSYSLYLWHQLLFATMAALLIHWGLMLSSVGYVYAVVFWSVALGVGHLSYRYLERPVLLHGGRFLVGHRVRAHSSDVVLSDWQNSVLKKIDDFRKSRQAEMRDGQWREYASILRPDAYYERRFVSGKWEYRQCPESEDGWSSRQF